MPYNLSASQQPVRDRVHAFAQREITHRVQALDRASDPPPFPYDLHKALGTEGFIGLPFPKVYGGGNATRLEYATLVEELCYHDPVAGLLNCVSELAGNLIFKFGNDDQRARYLPDVLSARRVLAFALTEPDAGSDAAALKTVARSTDDGYLLTGDKTFIMHGDVAHLVILFARIDDDSKISAMIAHTDQPGWEAWGLKYKMGMRGATTGAARVRSLHVPRENLIGERGKGLTYALQTLDSARIGCASQGVGLGQRALDESISYANRRIAFGAPIASQQAIQWMVANMSTRLEAARLLTYKAAQLVDQGERVTLEAAQAKLAASEAAHYCVDKAMQIHGGYGYIGEFSIIEKLYRDQRVLEIYEGTSEIQRLVIAGHLLGKR